MDMIHRFLVWQQRKQTEKDTKTILSRFQMPEGISLFRNIPYAGGEVPEHYMDVYVPAEEKKMEGQPLPAIVCIHGGGLFTGSKEMNAPLCSQLAREGFLVIALEYQKLPEHTLREVFDDLMKACNLVDDIILDQHGSLEHVCLVGDSGGGYLALRLAAILNNPSYAEKMGYDHMLPPYQISGLGLISPLIYSNFKDPSGWFFGGLIDETVHGNQEILALADPDAEDILTALPPVYLICADDDNMQANTMAYEKVLKAQGNAVHLENYQIKGLGHDFPVFHPFESVSQEAVKQLADYLKTVDHQKA